MQWKMVRRSSGERRVSLSEEEELFAEEELVVVVLRAFMYCKG